MADGLGEPIRTYINMKLLNISALALIASCATVDTSTPAGPAPSSPRSQWVYSSDLKVSHPPFQEVHCNWKDRLDQPYVFLENLGPYADTGALIPEVHRLLAQQGIQPAGPPFGLYYDDPSSVEAGMLRSRACVPVGSWTQPALPLKKETLPSRTVAYALASGPYPGVPSSYPGIFGYMSKMNWAIAGPIREIYMIPPSEVDGYDQLISEVQVPVTRR